MKYRMLTKVLALTLVGTALFSGICTPLAEGEESRFAMPSLDVPCRAAILVEQTTGTVLFEKEADTPMPMASITKVMTLLLTF